MLFFVSGSGQMLARGEFRATDPDALEFRRKALRDAVMCIGFLKFFSLICYMLIYALVHVNNKEGFMMSGIIEFMILGLIAFQVVHGMLLIFGAARRNIIILYIALALFLVSGPYNAVLGVMGAVHYIMTAHLTMHFILIIVFLLLALSVITIVCHDVFVVTAFIRVLKSRSNPRTLSATVDPRYVNTSSTAISIPPKMLENL